MHIVIVEDSVFLRTAWESLLTSEGFTVTAFATPEEFVDGFLDLSEVALVVTDWFFDPLSQLSGADIIAHLQGQPAPPPLVIASDAGELVQGQPCAGIVSKDQVNRAGLTAFLS